MNELLKEFLTNFVFFVWWDLTNFIFVINAQNNYGFTRYFLVEYPKSSCSSTLTLLALPASVTC